MVNATLALTMGEGSKSKRSRDKGGEHSTKKKHKPSHRESSKKHRHGAHNSVHITDDDPDDDDMWVEKNIDIDGERVCTRLSSCGTCSHQVLSFSQRTYRPQRVSS